MVMNSSSERLYDWLKKIAVPRPGGSEEEARIVNMVKKELEDAGGEPVLEPFEIFTSVNQQGTFKILEPFEKEISCSVIGLSGNTPEEGVTAPFKFMEYIAEPLLDDLEGYVLMYHRSSGKPDIFKNLREKGVKALVRIARPEIGPANVSLTEFIVHKYGRVPTIMIPYDDAVDIIQKKASLVKVKIAQHEKSCESRNMELTITGKTNPNEVIYIGSHIDSVPGTQGASDNAAGSVMNLELAKHFLANRPNRTFKFVWFGSEELGLNGSIAYVKKHWKEMEKARLMVNLDVGGGTIAANEAFITGPETLWRYVEVLGKELGMYFAQVKNDGKSLSSDHVAFGYAGVPNVCVERNGGHTEFLHTAKDRVEYLDGDRLKQVTDFVGEFLTRVDSARCFPFEREVREEHKEHITKFFTDFIGIDPAKDLASEGENDSE